MGMWLRFITRGAESWAALIVTERIMPGVISIDHGSKYDPIVPGELDRGGAINTIVPHKVTSKNSYGYGHLRFSGGDGTGQTWMN